MHVFYCVVALTLANLTWCRVRLAGTDISPKAMPAELAEIKLVDLVCPPAGSIGRPSVQCMTSQVSDLKERLVSVLGLEACMPGG